MISMENVYPTVFTEFMESVKDTFSDIEVYPYEINIIDESFISPCFFLGSMSFPNEGFCGGIDNMEIIFNFSIAIRKTDIEALEATARVLKYYGKFLDTYDTLTMTYSIEGTDIGFKGDIINTSPRMRMVDDGAYGAKILDFEYSIESLVQNAN